MLIATHAAFVLLAAASSGIATDTVRACTSSQQDDSAHESCFGWCAVSAAETHCKWCACRGCNWCEGGDSEEPADSASPGTVASAVVPITQGATCTSEVTDDVTFRDCQPFCDAAQAATHCSTCKCKGCHFCACESGFEDDSSERMCESWCTADYYQDHCSRCKCQSCEFCTHGPPCTPSLADDLPYEACESFCSAEFALDHCSMCKCKGCGFCKAPKQDSLLSGATCNSGIEGDVNHEICQDFCDPANREDHCSMCKCRGCDFCACSSNHANDTALEVCSPWCNANEFDTHCDWCACKGCRFCRAGGKSCKSFYLTGDTDHEACESFCDAGSPGIHCSYCKCKHCPFCRALAHTTESKEKQLALPKPSDDAVACFSGLARDSLYEQCESFCDPSNAGEHCKLCKCRTCPMCSASCNSGLPGDVSVFGCSSMCDPALVSAGICTSCRCRACSFCNEDGMPAATSSAQQLAAPSTAVATTASNTSTCTPFNSKDIDRIACHAHCNEANKGAHCETCRCKGCSFCQGFRACTSGIGHDYKWEDCDEIACGNKASDCNLCKCRRCSKCTERTVTTERCESGILGDSEFAACISGVCSSAHREAHCQLCACKSCPFCERFDLEPQPPPPPQVACSPTSAADTTYRACTASCSPAHATSQCKMCRCSECSFCHDTPPSCHSPHLADSKSAICEPFCKDLDDHKIMCSFCSCRGCSFCTAMSEETIVNGLVAVDASACPIGPQMQVMSYRAYKGNNWHYRARVRFGEWQPGALVSVDMSRSGKTIELNTDELEEVSIKHSDASGFQVALGLYADSLNGFAFEFTCKGGQLDLAWAEPAITCTHTRVVSPSPPSPPPPPHQPFFRPPPVSSLVVPGARQRGATQQCALGGKAAITGVWAGGMSFKGNVVMALWKPGAEVVLDFVSLASGAFQTQDLSNLKLTHVEKATSLEAAPGTLRFKLGDAADQADGFNFVGHGGKLQHARIVVRCTLPGKGTSTTTPARHDLTGAVLSPTCTPLGLSYTVIQEWQGGFKAAFAVRSWQQGAKVYIRYSGEVSVLDQWSATRAAGGGTRKQGGITELAFTLGDTPDEERHGFGFSARAGGGVVDMATPHVSCEVDTAAMARTPVTRAACGMGAAYSVTPSRESLGAYSVHVRLSQWQSGASVGIRFARNVETLPMAGGTAEVTTALGHEHTFTLGSHPDAEHGFAVNVKSADAALPQIERLTCKPAGSPVDGEQGSKPAMADVAPHSGSPGEPTRLTAVAKSCDSIELSWHPAVDNGYAVTSYRVYWRRREAANEAFESQETSGTRFLLTGLSGGTTYYLKVRAKNIRGEGKYSSRVEGATPSAGAPTFAADAPTPQSSPDCHSLSFTLPRLRPGCHGDSYLSLQKRTYGGYASDAGWTDAVPMTVEQQAIVRDLEPFNVYEFRLVPHNSQGAGPPGENTGPLMVDSIVNVASAPRVRAVGSASFSLTWSDLSSACRPETVWRVSYAQSVSSGGAGARQGAISVDWRVLSSEAIGTSFMAQPLRCMPPGCIFRIQMGGGGRWAPPSASSAVVPSVALPRLVDGAVRLELRLSHEQPDQDALQMAQDVKGDLTGALKVDSDAVTIQEVFGSGRYIVVDLHAAVQGSERDPSSATLLAQQIQIMVSEKDGKSGLSAALVLNELEQVEMVIGDVTTAIRVGNEAKAKAKRVGKWYGRPGGLSGSGGSTFGLAGDDDGVLGRARWITMFLVGAACCVWCGMGGCVGTGRGGENGYGLVSAAE